MEKCEFCEFETYELEESTDGFPRRTGKLCKLCMATFAGTAYFYPSQYKSNSAILRSISYVGNKIIEAIENQ